MNFLYFHATMKPNPFLSAFFFTMLFCCLRVCAQDTHNAVIFHISSPHTSFPDTARRNGHIYEGKLYTAADHYNDSTVLIIAPKNLVASKKVDLIFWFHGWGNNVDSAAIRYELTKQFIESKRNAVLVLPETARNAPDSYGGKLERPGTFNKLVKDVLEGLVSKKLIPSNCDAGHIVLAGHSGAYRVIAGIIESGRMPIDEVILFDALYAETDKFMDWIKADNQHRFVNIYTNHGGTMDECKAMINLINDADINNFEVEEKALAPQQLKAHRIIFIHSLKEHNDIINPDNFRLMLQNQPFIKMVKQ